MKYSKPKTIAFADTINKVACLKNLNALVIVEGCSETMPFFENDDVVIDMDCVEHKVASAERRIPNKSMDSAFIISNATGLRDAILLVEFRFNYVNMKNLDKKVLFDKVFYSSNVLGNPANLHRQYIYIFNSNLKNQAIRRFRNMVPSMPSTYIATDLKTLKNIYF